MFEDEYRAACRPPPKVEFVLSDASLLLPPTVSFAHSGPESEKKIFLNIERLVFIFYSISIFEKYYCT